MKFTLIAEDEPWFTSDVGDNATTKRTVEFRADGLVDILFEIDLFLKGAGFHFDHLEAHQEDDELEAHQEDDELDEPERQIDLVFDEETAGPILHNPVKMKANK